MVIKEEFSHFPNVLLQLNKKMEIQDIFIVPSINNKNDNNNNIILIKIKKSFENKRKLRALHYKKVVT